MMENESSLDWLLQQARARLNQIEGEPYSKDVEFIQWCGEQSQELLNRLRWPIGIEAIVASIAGLAWMAGRQANMKPKGECVMTCVNRERCSVIECDQLAEWAIYDEEPYNEAYACTKHVGDLLTDAEVHWIYPHGHAPAA